MAYWYSDKKYIQALKPIFKKVKPDWERKVQLRGCLVFGLMGCQSAGLPKLTSQVCICRLEKARIQTEIADIFLLNSAIKMIVTTRLQH